MLSEFADEIPEDLSITLNPPMKTMWKLDVTCIKYYNNTDSDKWMHDKFLYGTLLAGLKLTIFHTTRPSSGLQGG